MGNYTSCHFQTANSSAKFIDADGNLRRLEMPVKAAELMLESPGDVICRAEEIRRTRRVAAMRADEELEGGKVYLLFPVGRANSRASNAEMAWIEDTFRGKRTDNGGDCKTVFPDRQRRKDGTSGLHVSDAGGEKDTGFSGHRPSNYRLWTPALETISEGGCTNCEIFR